MKPNRYLTILATVAVVAVISAAVAATLAFSSTNSTLASNCQQIENLKGAIRSTISLQARSIGVKGSVAYNYFHEHPEELAAARKSTLESLQTFAPQVCP